MHGQGRRAVTFRNRLGGDSTMRAAHDAVGRAVEAWAELQVAGFAARAGRLDNTIPRFREACRAEGIPVHLIGDFPLLARLDHTTADDLFDAVSKLDWAAFGLMDPHRIINGQVPSRLESIGLDEQSDGMTAGAYEGGGMEELEVSRVVEDEDEEEDDDDTEWVGRRATREDKRAMAAVGLSHYQTVQVRLMLWEKPAKQWESALRQIVGSNQGLILRLLTAFL